MSTAAPPAEPARRRKPTQSRARFTVDAILDAAARLLAGQEHEDGAAPSTDRIAELAGVSIGTLYQYFPDRDAIVRALVQREREAALARLDELVAQGAQALAGCSDGPPCGDAARQGMRALLRAYVAAYVRSFGGEGAAGRALARLAWRHDREEDALVALRAAGERLAAQLQALEMPGLRVPGPAQMYVLTRALFGSVRAASLERSPLLGTAAFEAELVRLCWAMLWDEGHGA